MFWSSINKCVDMKGETKTETETETKLVWQIGSPHFSNIKKEIYIYIYIMAINNDNNDDSNAS